MSAALRFRGFELPRLPRAATCSFALFLGLNVMAETFTYAGKWGKEGKDPGQFRKPVSVAVGPQTHVYVVDQGNHRIQVFTADGEFVRAWGSHGLGNGRFTLPRSVAVGADGTVFVTDWARHTVQCFDPGGQFLRLWGGRGTDEGRLQFPTGIAVAPDGRVYVADTGNLRIQVFEPDGTFVRRIVAGGLRPVDLGVTPAGNIRTVSFHNSYYFVLDAAGEQLVLYPRGGTGPGRFLEPGGMACDAEGRFFVADTRHHCVHILAAGPPKLFKIDGVFGTRGAENGQFEFPYDVAAAPDGRVYVADKYNHRIQVFTSDAGIKPVTRE